MKVHTSHKIRKDDDETSVCIRCGHTSKQSLSEPCDELPEFNGPEDISQDEHNTDGYAPEEMSWR